MWRPGTSAGGASGASSNAGVASSGDCSHASASHAAVVWSGAVNACVWSGAVNACVWSGAVNAGDVPSASHPTWCPPGGSSTGGRRYRASWQACRHLPALPRYPPKNAFSRAHGDDDEGPR